MSVLGNGWEVGLGSQLLIWLRRATCLHQFREVHAASQCAWMRMWRKAITMHSLANEKEKIRITVVNRKRSTFFILWTLAHFYRPPLSVNHLRHVLHRLHDE